MAFFALYAVGMAALLWYTLSYLPYPVLTRHFGFALNIIQFGLLSLLSFLVYRCEKVFRGIFLQFWLLFAMYALTGPVILHLQFWMGPMAGFKAYVLVNIIARTVLVWTMAKILFTYVFREEKPWAINLLSTLVALPLCLWLFWPYYVAPEKLLELPTAVSAATLYRPIERASGVVNMIGLLMLLAFFLHKLRTDKPIGVFADTLLFLFGLFCLVDTVEILARVTSLELMNISQWASGLVVAAMIVTMILRLRFKSKAMAQYYESQLLRVDPGVDRRIGLFDRFILWCFFDPKKVGQRVFLGAGRQKVTVRRSSPRISRPASKE